MKINQLCNMAKREFALYKQYCGFISVSPNYNDKQELAPSVHLTEEGFYKLFKDDFAIETNYEREYKVKYVKGVKFFCICDEKED